LRNIQQSFHRTSLLATRVFYVARIRGTSTEYGLVIILIFQLCAPVCHQEMLSGAHLVVVADAAAAALLAKGQKRDVLQEIIVLIVQRDTEGQQFSVHKHTYTHICWIILPIFGVNKVVGTGNLKVHSCSNSGSYTSKLACFLKLSGIKLFKLFTIFGLLCKQFHWGLDEDPCYFFVTVLVVVAFVSIWLMHTKKIYYLSIRSVEIMITH
jgi:hypothetical protein